MAFAEPDSSGRLYPKEVLGHLLLVWSVAYIPHAPSKYTRPDKPSDAVQVDVVDLDQEDPFTGEEGLLQLGCWWRPQKLIQSLRNRAGGKDPILARMQMGTASPGMNAPYELVSATRDPDAVRRANQWLKRNPDFTPTVVPAPGAEVDQPPAVDRTPVVEPAGPRGETIQERLARIATEGAERLPRPPSTDVPPY